MRSLFLIATGVSAVSAAQVNPIRKIVTLLQDMKKEVQAEGEKNQELFEKFMCYCKTNKETQGNAAEAAEAAIAALEAQIKADSSRKATIEGELAQHKEDRADAKKDLATASALRDKENKEYVASNTDATTNLNAVSSAIPALEKGMGASFIQSAAGASLKRAVAKVADNFAADEDRETMMAFLEQSGDYAPQAGQIVGILKNMKDEMEKDLGSLVEDEKRAVASFGELKAAKEKEIAAASSAIESKTERVGKLAVKVVQGKGDLENAEDERTDAQQFQADLEKDCATKEGEHNENVKTRAEEVAAIGQAIGILNDDDALEIFNSSNAKKQALVQTGFLQMRNTKAKKLSHARALLSSMKIEKNPALALLQSSIVSKIKSAQKTGKVDFSKVLKMIDEMVDLLKAEQKSDRTDLNFCNKEFEDSDDEQKAHSEKKAALESQVAELKDTIAAVAQDIANLNDKIAALDKTVAEAGEDRKAENAEYVQQKALNEAAVQLIFKAKNRLQKFYNPSLHVKEQRRQLTQEEQISVNNGGVDPRDAEDADANRAEKERMAGLAFVQVRNFAAPGEAPAVGGHSNNKKSGGVVALMDMLSKEVETGLNEARMAEETAQKEYEELVADAQATRAQDMKSVTDATAKKADLEGQLDEAKATHRTTSEALKTVTTYIADLHQKCDFLLANFADRKEKRTNEIDGLKNAKAVLSGADYGL